MLGRMNHRPIISTVDKLCVTTPSLTRNIMASFSNLTTFLSVVKPAHVSDDLATELHITCGNISLTMYSWEAVDSQNAGAFHAHDAEVLKFGHTYFLNMHVKPAREYKLINVMATQEYQLALMCALYATRLIKDDKVHFVNVKNYRDPVSYSIVVSRYADHMKVDGLVFIPAVVPVDSLVTGLAQDMLHPLPPSKTIPAMTDGPRGHAMVTICPIEDDLASPFTNPKLRSESKVMQELLIPQLTQVGAAVRGTSEAMARLQVCPDKPSVNPTIDVAAAIDLDLATNALIDDNARLTQENSDLKSRNTLLVARHTNLLAAEQKSREEHQKVAAMYKECGDMILSLQAANKNSAATQFRAANDYAKLEQQLNKSREECASLATQHESLKVMHEQQSAAYNDACRDYIELRRERDNLLARLRELIHDPRVES